MISYKPTASQRERLSKVEHTSDRRQFPRFVNENMGQRVSIRSLHDRDDDRRATDIRIAYSTFVPSHRKDQYRIEHDGGSKDIFYRRITTIHAVDKPLPETDTATKTVQS